MTLQKVNTRSGVAGIHKYGRRTALNTNHSGDIYRYMGTVVLIVKISFKHFSHCVDSEDKLYTFCTLCLRVLFTFHIYLNTISYQVAAGQITWARKGHNLLFVNFTLLCQFLK